MTLAELVLPATAENIANCPTYPHRLVTLYRQHWRKEPCVYCGNIRPRRMMTKEHIKPVSACGGGEGRTWENIAPACMQCNTERGAMPLLRYLVWKSYELRGTRRLTKKQRKAMGFTHSTPPEEKFDKAQPFCHSKGIKEMDMNNSNAVHVTGGFIGGTTGHWDKSTLAKAQETHAARIAVVRRAVALDIHAGEN